MVTRGFAEADGGRLYYEEAGTGHPLVLIHAGIADRRMYDDQFEVFAQKYRVIRYDLRSYGESDLPLPDNPMSFYGDLYSLLTFLGIERTYLLGTSMGGTTALDLTLAHPGLVDGLILVGSGASGRDGSAFEAEYGAIEAQIEAFAERGEYEQAAELETRIWIDGPRRTPEQVDPAVRQKAFEMNLFNYKKNANVQYPPVKRLDPPAIGRLGEVAVPTCVIIGTEDVRDLVGLADVLTEGITGAKKVVIEGASHLPSLEKPEEFNRAVLAFLEEIG
jgi:pimeloyl-ACP methyl ester carboxylesterase